MRQEKNPEYAWLKEFKRASGRELLRRYGAHAIGIGHKRVGGHRTGQLALIFYVERKGPPGGTVAEPIPPSLTFTPSNSDHPVQLLTDIVESAPAVSE
jgi:hypothetical protein